MVAQIQKPAPEFAGTLVKEGEFSEIKKADFEGKWVVLSSYPMDFTFVCPTEILAFNAALEQFKAINTEVILFSTDSEYSHLAWANTPRKEGGLGPDLKVGLLADRSHAISKAYGVLIEEEGIDLRGTFFIDPKGILRASHIHDLPVGRSVEETIRVIKAFQFVDEHGEVCPANWEEGKDTIDTANADKYFTKHADVMDIDAESEADPSVKRKIPGSAEKPKDEKRPRN